MTRIILGGHYSNSSMSIAKDSDVADLGFDFRPKSFQFIQQYKFLELLRDQFDPAMVYYLHFEDEKDFVIKKFIDDLRAEQSSLQGFVSIERHFRLVFSDKQKSAFYESFGLPYYWHYREDVILSDYLSGELLKGVIFSLSHFQGDLSHYLSEGQKRTHASLETLCVVDWDSDLFPSLFTLFSLDGITLSINDKVEQSYRQVDGIKLAKMLTYYERFLRENILPEVDDDEDSSKQ
jgi:hypothetical protein